MKEPHVCLELGDDFKILTFCDPENPSSWIASCTLRLGWIHHAPHKLHLVIISSINNLSLLILKTEARFQVINGQLIRGVTQPLNQTR